jgi:hypothetical protein
VLSLVPLKRMALSARVVSSEPRPQPLSAQPLPSRAEEESTVVAAAEESSAPPPQVPIVAIEEGHAAAEATAPQTILEPPTEAGPSGEDVVMVLDKDPAPPPSSGSHDVVMTSASEPTLAVATVDPLPSAEVLEPSPAAEVPGPFPTAEVAKTSSV